MNGQRILALAYGSLMALIFAGTYVLGDDSWMAYLLFVPGFLILKAMAISDRSSEAIESAELSDPVSETRLPHAVRAVRVVVAFLVLGVPTALLVEALELDDWAIGVLLVPILLLGSLVDREFFGWTDSDDSGVSRSVVD
jgi:hypothetical protein